jgi:hypothetical protein
MGWCWAARGKWLVGLSRIATRAARRGKESSQLGWGEFWSMAIRKNEKGIFILQIFSKFRTNLNSNEIYNFDDFHSHNKL